MKNHSKADTYHTFCGVASVGERGQIVIPKEARKKMNIKTGDNFVAMIHDGSLVLLPKKKMEKYLKFLSKKLHI